MNERTTLRKMVLAFHEMIGQPSPSTPAVPDIDRVRLRARLVTEEYFELMDALHGDLFAKERLEAAHRVVLSTIDQTNPTPDIVALADACADLAYVVEGTNLEFGIDGEAVMAEVHRTNMAKASGPVRADGKRGKPAGWTPPDIAGVLRRLGWLG